MNRVAFLFLCLLSLLSSRTLEGAYFVKNGNLVKEEYMGIDALGQHMELGRQALHAQEWKKAIKHYRTVVESFPKEEEALEACFHLGEAYFQYGDGEMAHSYLEKYLSSGHTRFFEAALLRDFDVAEAFRQGAKRHLFGSESFPQWLPAKKQAREIYEEIIASYPGHEVAAKSHRSLARLDLSRRQYQEAVASLEGLIQRFPMHELTVEAYLDIADIYLQQQRAEYRNPDLLERAKINLERFERHFPRHERIADIVACIDEMRGIYAEGMFTTGQFYERIEKRKASVIYYMAALKDYPETAVAKSCQARLQDLRPELNQLQIAEDYLICEQDQPQ